MAETDKCEESKEETDILENLKRKKGSNKIFMKIKGIVWAHNSNSNLNNRRQNGT